VPGGKAMRTGATCFIGILVIVASLVAAPVPAYSLDDVVGWEGTAWGMTESEVTKSMASRGFNLVAGPPRLGGPSGGDIPLQTKVDIDGNTYDVAFRFSDRTRGLTEVLIGTVAGSPDHAVALHDSLLRALTAQYGPATGAESRHSTTSLTRWMFKTTTIVLHRDTGTAVRGRHLGHVSIVYLPTTRSDQREPDEGILLLLMLQMLGKGRR
jgi:hypothetical protein